MKNRRRLASMGLAALLTCFAAFSILSIPSCETDRTAAPEYDPNSILVKYSDCKQFESLAAGGTPANRDCVEYRYEQPGTLILTHVNAAFNCCPGQIFADIEIRADTITIVEREREAGCHCLCLYDLEYRFPELPLGAYTIVIVEPYATEEDTPIDFTIELDPYSAGGFCAARDHYPWDPGGVSESPLSYQIGYWGCAAPNYIPALESVPPDLDCVEYRGIGGCTLLLDHLNAAFNCCAGQMGVSVTISNDTITIAEHEESAPCDCHCLFNLQYRVMNLEPRPYTVRIVEPYVWASEEQIVFDVDLSAAPLNFRAVYRGHRYPWNYAGSFEQDTTAVEKMRRSIREYASWYNRCSGEGECRYIGFGVSPCGGPREYIVYSTAQMNVEYFRSAVCRFNEIEYAFNRRYGIASPCVVPPVPNPGCIEGTCADLNGD